MVKIKLKRIVIFQTIFLIIALIIIFFLIFHNSQPDYLKDNGKIKLLSPRIYSGIIKPESYLILNWNPLEEKINNFIQNNSLNVSVYVLNMRDGASFGVDEDEEFDSLSLNKIPVAMIILKKVEEGKLSIDTKLKIPDKYRDPEYGTLYKNPATELSVKDLLRYMLSESDNTAFFTLEQQITFQNLKDLSSYLYFYSDIDSGLSPSKKFAITPKSTSNIFTSLYLSTFLTPEDSETILSYLTNNSFDIKTYAKIPNDVTIAHKNGAYNLENKNIFHDCGIMYIEDSRIFYCVMTNGLEENSAYNLIGSIVKGIYNYVVMLNKDFSVTV